MYMCICVCIYIYIYIYMYIYIYICIYWAYRFLEVKDWIVSDTEKNPMVVAECPKIFDVQ